MSINSVIISGNITRDASVTQVSDTTAVLKYGIACNKRVMRGGDYVDEARFFDVEEYATVKQAEAREGYRKSGQPVTVRGELAYDAWESADGSKKSRVYIEVGRDGEVDVHRRAS